MKTIVRICAAATVVLAVGAGSAQAAVTQSNISAPADPYVALINQDPAPPNVPVSGTSNGTTGDTVDITCWADGSEVALLADDVPVAANGSFSAPGNQVDLPVNTCYLRAIPVSGVSTGLAQFKGPRMVVSDFEVSGEVVGGPNDGLVFDYDATANGLRGYWELNSLSASGIDDGSPYGLPTFDDEAGAWDDGARADAFDDDNLRASIVVDGNFAYGPAAAAGLFAGAEDNAGLQPTVFSVTQNAQTGQVTVTETAALVRCPTNSTVPDGLNCGSFASAGVSWQRTHVVGEGGRQVLVTDRLTSTNGAQHAVDLLLMNDFEESETGWRFPPYTSEPSRFNNGDVTAKSAMPAAPFTLIADEADDEPGDSLEGGFGGLTFATTPEQLRWMGDDRFEAQYLLTVPASGSVQVRHGYSQAFTQPDVLALGLKAEYAMSSPNTSIRRKPRRRTTRRRATFSFASTHLRSTFQCKLDGGKFKPCAQTRRFRGLKPRRHRLQVRAVNEFGNVDPTPASYRWRVKRRTRGG
jgi:hypothetical protein